MRILYKLTTRSRPELANRAIKSIEELSLNNDYLIWVTVDSDDESANKISTDILTYALKYFGQRAGSKIASINRDLDIIKNFQWDILVNVSDDQVFRKEFFDADICDAFKIENSGGEYNLDQFIHFPDGNRKDLCTMSIIGRKYFERDGYIYHPHYITECCDDEAQEVAKIRGCYKFVDKEIFHHLHPAYGKAQWDSNYAVNMTIDKQSKDRDTLEKRRIINFEINE